MFGVDFCHLKLHNTQNLILGRNPGKEEAGSPFTVEVVCRRVDPWSDSATQNVYLGL